MKLFFIALSALICVYSCNAQNADKQLVREFIEHVILEDSVEVEKMRQYLDIYDGFDKEPKAEKRTKMEWIQYFIDMYKKHLNAHGNSFKVVAYTKVRPDTPLSKNIFFKKLVYENKDEVYYITSVEQDDIYFMILVKGSKIISFFPHLRHGEDKPIYPYLLNIK